MKICPVCGDATFDDQPICFGCLHRYDDEALVPEAGDGSNDVGYNGGDINGTNEVSCKSDGGGCNIDGSYSPNDGISANDTIDGNRSGNCKEACPLLKPATLRVSLMPEGEEAGVITWSCTINLDRSTPSAICGKNKTGNEPAD